MTETIAKRGMRQIRYEWLLEAAQPIAHAEGNFGNTSTAMRRRVRQVDGTFADVPIVTADTMRHGLRESCAYATLDAASILSTANLSEAALRLLFAGGMITGRGDASAVKLAEYRSMVDVLPMLALFGGCAGSRCIPGRLNVDDAVLVCEEGSRFLPDWVRAWLAADGAELDTCRTAVEEVQRVRMDPTLDPGKRKLLSSGAAEGAEGRLLASEEAHDADDAVGRSDAKSSMMPRRFERVAQGSLFFWAVEATLYSDLDEDTFHTAIAVFLAHALVGGKKGTGHGLLRVVERGEGEEREIGARKIDVPRFAERVETCVALQAGVGAIFRAHVADKADALRKFLAAVDA